MSDDIPVSPDQFLSALDAIKERLVVFFDHDLTDLEGEWERLTGETATRGVTLALAELRLAFGHHEIVRALRITAYRNGFARPDADGNGGPVPVSTWAVRQLLSEWRQDGRYGLEG